MRRAGHGTHRAEAKDVARAYNDVGVERAGHFHDRPQAESIDQAKIGQVEIRDLEDAEFVSTRAYLDFIAELACRNSVQEIITSREFKTRRPLVYIDGLLFMIVLGIAL